MMVRLDLDPDDPVEAAVIEVVRFHRIGRKELREKAAALAKIHDESCTP